MMGTPSTQSDGTKMGIENGSVDLILLNHVFHEVEDKRATLREFGRILKPSGRIAIVEKTRGSRPFRSLGPPIIDVNELTRELKDSGFSPARVIPHGRSTIIIGTRAEPRS